MFEQKLFSINHRLHSYCTNVQGELLVSSLLASGIGEKIGCNLKTLEKNRCKNL